MIPLLRTRAVRRRRAPGFEPGLGRLNHPARRRTCGVAFSTHYYTVFLVVPLALAVWHWRARAGGSRVVRGLDAGGLRPLRLFFALSPFLLVKPMTAWNDIVANRRIVIDRAGSSGGRTVCVGAGLSANAVDGSDRLACRSGLVAGTLRCWRARKP